MANHLLNIHIKNMAGDLVSVSIASGLTVEKGLEAAKHALVTLDETTYPASRTQLFRLEEEKGPLADEEMVCVMVSEPARVETVSIPGTESAQRMIIPLEERIVYVYSMVHRLFPGTIYYATFSDDVEVVEKYLEDIARIAHLHRDETIFYNVLCLDIATALTDIGITGTKDRSEVYRRAYELIPDSTRMLWVKRRTERYECECGSNLKRSSFYSHFKSKKHMDYMKAHPTASVKWMCA
jgi:hypothetical protein